MSHIEALRKIVDEMRVCLGLPWFPAFTRTGDWANHLQAAQSKKLREILTDN